MSCISDGANMFSEYNTGRNSLIHFSTMTSCEFHTWLRPGGFSQFSWVCSARNFSVNASWHGSLQPSRVQFVKLLLESEQNSAAAPLWPKYRAAPTHARKKSFSKRISAQHMLWVKPYEHASFSSKIKLYCVPALVQTQNVKYNS